jgi:glycerate 2-kinase
MSDSDSARRYLVAPDSFKGTMGAPVVAKALADGLISRGLSVDLCPVADGGEGTAETVRAAVGGTVRSATVHDPLGRVVEADYVVLDDGATAILDMASASGLPLVAAADRDPEAASTRGTGELILAAIAGGVDRVVVAAGGSATTDGGVGAIDAINGGGGAEGVRLEVLCDVETTFEEAPSVFGPQKGADAATVARLDRRLEEVAASLPRDPRGLPMGGCAGGLSGGLWAAFDAQLIPGARSVLRQVAFSDRLARADVVITGEGRIDSQSFEGKLVGEIASVCEQTGRPLHVVVGRDELAHDSPARGLIASIREAGSPDELAEAAREIADSA